MSRSPEVVVIGAGVMGAWTAFWARRSGLATTLFDAWGIGDPRATSADESRIIRSAHGSDDFYPGWARRAMTHWRRFAAEWEDPFVVETGVAWFAHREDGFEARSIETLTRLGIPVERLSVAEIGARWPGIGTEDLAFAAFEPDAGALLARRAVAAVGRALERDGGRIAIADVRPGRVRAGRLVDVVVADGSRIAADTFVFAAGPWLPSLFPDVVGDRIRVTRQDVLYVGAPAGDDRFRAGRLPTWIDYDRAFFGIPSIDGRAPKVASDSYGPPFDPTTGERTVDPAAIATARTFLRDRLPDLADGPIVETRVCQYETTPDTNFIIDRHPRLENAWIVGGGSGHGFKHGPRIGEYVVERLLGAPAGPGEERFSLTRPRGAPTGLRSGSSES